MSVESNQVKKPDALDAKICWGPEQQGKNPLTDYIPPSSKLRVCPYIEQPYKTMLENKTLTLRMYNYIQASRLYFHETGECPFYVNDL